MNIEQRKYNSFIEITDLIGEAVNNAVARRKENVETQESLWECSEEEAKGVVGGVAGGYGGGTTMGYIGQKDSDLE